MVRYFDLNTHTLAYRLQETPGKPLLLLLHGCGANHTQFDREFLRLAEDYSVAAISLRGQGDSTRPSGNNPEDMKISALASDLIQWLAAHGWQRPHVIACSMGGVVALEALQQQGNLFRSLITFGTTPRLKVPKGMKTAIWLADVLLPGLFPNWMARTMAKATTDKPEAQERFIQDLKIAYGQRQTIYHLRCQLANYDYLPVLRASTIPVLLLQGEKDKDLNKEIEKYWPEIQKNPLVRREYLADAGHIANYDQPESFYASVVKFLRSLDHA